jgi:hypothetical protein
VEPLPARALPLLSLSTGPTGKQQWTGPDCTVAIPFIHLVVHRGIKNMCSILTLCCVFLNQRNVSRRSSKLLLVFIPRQCSSMTPGSSLGFLILFYHLHHSLRRSTSHLGLPTKLSRTFRMSYTHKVCTTHSFNLTSPNNFLYTSQTIELLIKLFLLFNLVLLIFVELILYLIICLACTRELVKSEFIQR